MVEQEPLKLKVIGSNPIGAIMKITEQLTDKCNHNRAKNYRYWVKKYTRKAFRQQFKYMGEDAPIKYRYRGHSG